MKARTRAPRRTERERGAAAVEFALLLIPLLLILLGILTFGLMLTFRQNLSQAATEGARAAAVQLDAAKRVASATSAVNQSMAASDVACGPTLTCTIKVDKCQNDASADCVSVSLRYPYRANAPIPAPLITEVLPENLVYTAVARVS